MLDSSRYKNKVFCKVKIDKGGVPFFIAQNIYTNTAKKEDIKQTLEDYWINNTDLLDDLASFIKPVSTQLRITGHPTTFLEQSAGKEFYELFKHQFSKFSKGNIVVNDAQWNEKEWPIAIFTLFQYRD